MVPAVRERYLQNTELIFMSAGNDPSKDFSVQMAKLGTALIDGQTGHNTSGMDGHMLMDHLLRWMSRS